MRIVATAYGPDHKATRVFRRDLPATWQLKSPEERMNEIQRNIGMVADQLFIALKVDQEELHAIDIAVAP